LEFLDRRLAATFAVFFVGALFGCFTVTLSPSFRDIFISIIQVRMLSPIQSASRVGSIALILLVFANNSVPAVLSFLYPLIVAKVNWTPPLTKKQMRILMIGYTYLSAFLTGFFGVGATLGLAWVLGGTMAAVAILFTSRVHAPIELFFVLVCIAEPLRLAEVQVSEVTVMLRRHIALLLISLMSLLLSAGIEVLMLM
jgi:hypothetical protein